MLACRQCRTLARCERVRRGGRARRRRHADVPRAAARSARRCAWTAALGVRQPAPRRVTRLREELEAAADRPAARRSPARADRSRRRCDLRRHRGRAPPRRARRHRRLPRLRRELLAPRYRAAEQAMALLACGGRGIGRPEVLVQTFLPRHEVVQAARAADPRALADDERRAPRVLGLPPFGALRASLGRREATSSRPRSKLPDSRSGGPVGSTLVRGPDWMELGRDLIATGVRPDPDCGSRSTQFTCENDGDVTHGRVISVTAILILAGGGNRSRHTAHSHLPLVVGRHHRLSRHLDAGEPEPRAVRRHLAGGP